MILTHDAPPPPHLLPRCHLAAADCVTYVMDRFVQVRGERGEDHPLQAPGGGLGHTILRGPQPVLCRPRGAG